MKTNYSSEGNILYDEDGMLAEFGFGIRDDSEKVKEICSILNSNISIDEISEEIYKIQFGGDYYKSLSSESKSVARKGCVEMAIRLKERFNL